MRVTRLAFMMLMCGVALAQGPDKRAATVSGRVVDAKDKGVGGVKAELLDCFTGRVTKIVIVDGNGHFMLAPDDTEAPSYCLRFSAKGFTPVDVSVDAKYPEAAHEMHVVVPKAWGGS